MSMRRRTMRHRRRMTLLHKVNTRSSLLAPARILSHYLFHDTGFSLAKGNVPATLVLNVLDLDLPASMPSLLYPTARGPAFPFPTAPTATAASSRPARALPASAVQTILRVGLVLVTIALLEIL